MPAAAETQTIPRSADSPPSIKMIGPTHVTKEGMTTSVDCNTSERMADESSSPHIILDWDVAGKAEPSSPTPPSTKDDDGDRFLPLETVMDNTARSMYSIVKSHLDHCNAVPTSSGALRRALDRANQRIRDLEAENARLRREGGTDSPRLDGLLQQATVQHVDDLRHELAALQQSQGSSSGDGWSYAVMMELARVDARIVQLKSILQQHEASPDDNAAVWHSICIASETRLQRLKMDLHLAEQKVVEYKASVAEHVLAQLHQVHATLAADDGGGGGSMMDTDSLSDEYTRRHKFRKCTVPDCQKGVRSRGLCKGHGGGKRCEEPGCMKSNQGGGYCIAHGGGRRCAIDGCKNAAQIRGFCKSHKERSDDGGDDDDERVAAMMEG
ncbi:Aste57867_1205 [Aphanomyces stellatus]|uniref:Aste57867_1205 protein n=1 Tax=Aphanomyces stellatus TaxID=120398 RepID=A0A485K7B2_9STRA|nr:hypothetical protein As57867_001204 [Aphanomyces stellatus]VFT78425.1 Aste57867_1205 [Aphanomyces stellatus]